MVVSRRSEGGDERKEEQKEWKEKYIMRGERNEGRRENRNMGRMKIRNEGTMPGWKEGRT